MPLLGTAEPLVRGHVYRFTLDVDPLIPGTLDWTENALKARVWDALTDQGLQLLSWSFERTEGDNGAFSVTFKVPPTKAVQIPLAVGIVFAIIATTALVLALSVTLRSAEDITGGGAGFSFGLIAGIVVVLVILWQVAKRSG